MPVDQAASQFVLQRLDAPAQRGLGQMQALRRLAEGRHIRHHQQMLEMFEMHYALLYENFE
ncbi:hypothetical protein D3C72_2487050 [compost metagenome]